MEYSENEKIALKRYKKGIIHSVSVFIDEDTIIAGYGNMESYDFEFPLPKNLIIEIYGTISWKERLKMHIKNQ